VERARLVDGLTLEDAIAKVSDESGMTDSLIMKQWKRRHKEAKMNFALMDEIIARWHSQTLDMLSDLPAILEAAETRCLTMSRRKKRQP
jgi:hypothetical protein